MNQNQDQLQTYGFHMEQEISIDFINDLKATHYFVYKGKQYPFNMKFFKNFSQYFQTHKNSYKNTTEINFLDDSEDKISLNETAINDFINFFYAKKIKLTKENALSLHFLAKKYIVLPLIEATSKFMSIHQKDVVIDLLILNQDDEEISTEEYEEMISKDFPNYVTDDRLLSLSIPVLHRIMSKAYQYHKPSEQNDQYNQNVTKFLFKCLDHFGRPSSVLFSFHQIQDSNLNFLTRLHEEYSTLFDFHFINEAVVSSFYNKESNILEQTSKLKIELEKKIEEQKEEIRKLKEEQEKVATQIQQIKKHEQEKVSSEIEKLKSQLEEMKKEKNNQIQQLKQEESDKINEIQNNFSSQLKSMMSQINDLKEKMKEITVKEEEKQKMTPSIGIRFSGNSNSNGLISNLGGGVTLSATGYSHPDYSVTNIKSYDDKSFYNFNYDTPRSESDSIIKFDFGSSRRVDLYSYYIRSNRDGPSYQHHKLWRIEGSNDDCLWTRLDRRLNDENLRGPYKKHHFECQENSHLDEQSRFRYIRYVQEDSWEDNHPYYVYISYFELYGDVFNN